MKIQIPPKLYEKCNLCSQNRWSNKKTGHFGRGLINSKDDPCKVERIGLLGEAALAQYINQKVDYEYKEGGTPFDFSLDGLNIDIKTAARNYGCGLIRAVSDRGAAIELKSDIYVFAIIMMDDRTNKSAEVEIKGIITKKMILKYPIVPARLGHHLNYEIPYCKLLPIKYLKSKDLIAFL